MTYLSSVPLDTFNQRNYVLIGVQLWERVKSGVELIPKTAIPTEGK